MSRGVRSGLDGYEGSQSRSELSPPSFMGEGLGPLAQGLVPTASEPVSNARLCAELHGPTFAIRMFGLDAINDGRVTINQSSNRSA